ncbi:MAG: hypothetical protein ACRECX_03410 [Methyloceanibacter sp.]|uniref:hypothetical protein n=1 Tax=Methyloceanibacter sp. TaxID=1965321 RepID=UPI003D6D84FD
MVDDNLGLRSYAAAMAKGEPFIILRLSTEEPIEIGAFVGAFAALGDEYDRYIKTTNPDLVGVADMYVREVRPGSIEADLIPWLSTFAPFISEMDKALIVENFIRAWGGRFQALLGKGQTEPPATRSELKDWADAVEAVANDPNGSATLEAATFEDGKKKVRAAFKFTTPEARHARRAIEARQINLERTERADHQRVLMRFTRSDIGDVNVGKRSGERVVIEEISTKPLALIYASELAEQRIKHEIRDADENVYKKGFVVDVNVRSSGGKPVAYAITNVHQVIDLPD